MRPQRTRNPTRYGDRRCRRRFRFRESPPSVAQRPPLRCIWGCPAERLNSGFEYASHPLAPLAADALGGRRGVDCAVVGTALDRLVIGPQRQRRAVLSESRRSDSSRPKQRGGVIHRSGNGALRPYCLTEFCLKPVVAATPSPCLPLSGTRLDRRPDLASSPQNSSCSGSIRFGSLLPTLLTRGLTLSAVRTPSGAGRRRV